MLKNIKIQLIVMFFLQFAILGSFIISLGGYLASIGLGEYIGQFYIIGGIVNLFFPALLGIVADRYIPAQRLYGSMHLMLTISLVIFALFLKQGVDTSDISLAIAIFAIISSLYYPTISLGFSIAFTSLHSQNIDVKNVLPPIRMFGTIGFVVAMVMTDLLGVQFSYGQFLVGAVFSFSLSAWSLILPDCPSRQTLSVDGLFSGFSLLKNRKLAIFFFFVLCVGITLKLSEAYVGPFVASLKVEHPNILVSVSRISETLCILLVPFSLKFLGIRKTIAIAILSWGLHFASMAYGGYTGTMWPLIFGMVIYGIGFDFFNLAGIIYVDSMVEPKVRSTAQGLFSMFTNGFGVVLGAYIGQRLFNSYVFSSASPDWVTPWFIISAGCFIVFCLFVAIRQKIQNS